MKPRLLILLVLTAGLAVYLAKRASAPPIETPMPSDHITDEERERIRDSQEMLGNLALPGEEPTAAPELDIRVEVDPTGKKNRLYYYITEAHGYYVESFEIDFWYKPTPDTPREDSPFGFQLILNDFLKANETYKSCTEIVSAEMELFGGDMGTAENWDAEIAYHGRARIQNPDPLPPVPRVLQCD